MIKRYGIIFLVGLVVVGALIFGVIWATNNLEPVEQPSDDPDYDVAEEYEREKGRIFVISNESLLKKVTVKNADDEYSVYKDETGVVRVEGSESVPLLTATSTALYECVLKILSETTIELSTKHLEYYGLDNPQATLTATIQTEGVEGQTYEEVFYLGDLTPDLGGYYFRKADSNTVYVVSTYFGKRLIGNRSKLYSSKIYTNYSDPTLDADWLTIEYPDGTVLTSHYVTSTEEYGLYGSAFVMDSPSACGANPTAIRDCFEDMFHTTANSVVCFDPTEEELTKYGFDSATRVGLRMAVDVSLGLINNEQNPYYDSTVTEETYISVTDYYTVGGFDKTKNVYYVMYNDGNVIYEVDGKYFEFLNYEFSYFRQSMLIYAYLVDIETVEVSYVENGETKSYRFDIYTKENASGDTILDYALYQGVKIGDDNKDNANHGFKAFYQDIIGVAAFDECEEPTGYEPVMTVTLRARSGETYTLEFVPIDEDELYYFVRVNGQGQFNVISSRKDNLVSDIEKMLRHEDFNSHYV